MSLGEIKRLNGTYRGKDTVTDVLSFPVYPVSSEFGCIPLPVAQHPAHVPAPPRQELRDGAEPALLTADFKDLGDIFIAHSVVVEDARGMHPPSSPATQLLRVAAHGLAHCLGHDHESEEDDAAMLACEAHLLRELAAQLPAHVAGPPPPSCAGGDACKAAALSQVGAWPALSPLAEEDGTMHTVAACSPYDLLLAPCRRRCNAHATEAWLQD